MGHYLWWPRTAQYRRQALVLADRSQAASSLMLRGRRRLYRFLTTLSLGEQLEIAHLGTTLELLKCIQSSLSFGPRPGASFGDALRNLPKKRKHNVCLQGYPANKSGETPIANCCLGWKLAVASRLHVATLGVQERRYKTGATGIYDLWSREWFGQIASFFFSRRGIDTKSSMSFVTPQSSLSLRRKICS